MHNLTDERLEELRKFPFSDLPSDIAVIRTKGRGERQFAIFEDPFCAYCRKLEPELESLDNYKAYIFTYPLFGDGSSATASAVWCSNDRLAAWQAALLSKAPSKAQAACDPIVKRISEFGKKLGISGTPTILFPDQSRHEGYMSASDLSAALDSHSGAKSALNIAGTAKADQ